MGYDASFVLVQPVDELLVCDVCTDLFESPVQVCSEGCTLCQACASAIKPRKCPLCQKPIKSAKSVKPNRLIAQLIEKIDTRCYNSGNVIDGSDGGEPAKKKIKTSASAAASVPVVPSVDGCPWTGPISGFKMHASECGFVKVDCPNESCAVSVYRHERADHAAVCMARPVVCNCCKDTMRVSLLPAHVANTCPKRLLACPNNGCLQASIPADQLTNHRVMCPCATVKYGFGGGACNGTYKRGVGSSDHDREATQAHLNIAMSRIDAQTHVIDDQSRVIEAQARTNTEQIRAIAEVKMHRRRRHTIFSS
jgi:hypothetical protein